MTRTLIIASTSLLLLTGCAARQKPGMCYIEVSREARPVLSANDWFDLLLHGYNREQGTAARPTLDCSGSPVVWQEPVAKECREPGPEVASLAIPERLSDEDLVMETVQADLRLVWVITRRFSNGEALGPVGLVERTNQGIIVRALGSLRSFPLHSRLHLERSGSVKVLVAEGEQCSLEAPGVCRRVARILPLRQGRFFAEAVTNNHGQCLGPAWFPLSREQLFELPGGMQRKMELTSTLKFSSEGISLNEEVTLHDLDPGHPSMSPRLFRRTQAERLLQVDDNSRLVGTDPSLWVRLQSSCRRGASPCNPSVGEAKSTP